VRGRLVGAVTAVGLAAALLAPLSGHLAAAAERAGPAPAARSDFDGDGFADLAVGVRFEDVGAVTGAGAVTIIGGSASGLGGDMTTWSQDSPGVGGKAATSDFFSSALATGDFDGDGFADLAIGAQLDDPAGVEDTGAVNVLYGSAEGLTATGSQYWYQDSPAVVEAAEAGDHFGGALAAGDFDGDGLDDLAVGVEDEDVGVVQDAGAVIVLRGTSGGLTGTGSRLLHQDRSGVPGQAAQRDNFGFSLAAGNLGRGRFDDLAVGVWLDDVVGDDGAGGVNVFYGSAEGLATTGSELWNQNSPGIVDQAENPDRFGYSVAIGNLGASKQADLAVGVPFESVGSVADAGAVNVIYGSPDGLTADGNQIWHQASDGVFGTTEKNDFFGFTVAVGNLGHTGQADLVVGVPREDASGAVDTGVVHVLYGSPTGVTSDGSQLWYQGTEGVAGAPEDGDEFGTSLAIGSFGKGAPKDLAVGVPVEDVGSVTAAGAVNVLYGSPSGLTVTGNQLWTQDSDGTDDAAESTDIFGGSLAST